MDELMKAALGQVLQKNMLSARQALPTCPIDSSAVVAAIKALAVSGKSKMTLRAAEKLMRPNPFGGSTTEAVIIRTISIEIE